MTKRVQSKFKIERRYGESLFGRDKSPLSSRGHRPGQHGLKPAGRSSEYRLQLSAKQKLKGHYDMTETSFRNIYQKADRLPGDTGENLLNMLERRLDSVVYRMKFAPTIFSARQIVNHGHIRVNGRRVNIKSYLVKDGDQIALHDTITGTALVAAAMESGERSVPEYLDVDHKHFNGKFVRRPAQDDIPFPFKVETNLIVAWYSRRI